MRPLKPETFVGARSLTLREQLIALRRPPLDDDFVRAHMEAELAKAPAATPYYGLLKHVSAFLFAILLLATACCAFAGITASASYFVLIQHGTGAAWAALASFAIVVLALWTMIRFDKVKIYDQARWVEVRLEQAQELVFPRLRTLVMQLSDTIYVDRIICAKLVQRSKTLDPVWFAERDTPTGTERICFAITDERDRILYQI